jgi:uncharacterized membrane protein YdjX (TVP38/TMEM64 family)
MDDRKIRILIALAFVIAVALFFYLDLGRYLTLESLKKNRDLLLSLYAGHRFAFIAVFLVAYIVQTALALPGAAILTMAAGAVFGAVAGTIFANIGATLGATLAFLLARHLFRDTIQGKFGPRLDGLNRELERAGLNYLLFLRLVPIFPFFLINLAAGLTRMPLRRFFIGTMIGIIPGGFVYCNAGASLASINSRGEILSLRVLGSFLLLGLFALVPVIYTKFRAKR